MIMLRRVVAVLLSGLVVAPSLRAESAVPAGAVEFSVAVGYGRFDTPLTRETPFEFWLLPRLAWYGEHAYFDNGLFGYALQESPSRQWDLVLYPNEDGLFFNLSGGTVPLAFTSPFPVPDQIRVIDTPERRIAAMAGLRFGWQHDDWNGHVQLGADASGVHNGGELEAELNCSPCFSIGPVDIGIGAGISWKSAELVSYYYLPRRGEIDPAEGDQYLDDNTDWRTVGPFDSQHGWRGQLQTQALWPLDTHWSLLLLYRHYWLSSAMTDSPLLSHADFGAGFTGLQYRF